MSTDGQKIPETAQEIIEIAKEVNYQLKGMDDNYRQSVFLSIIDVVYHRKSVEIYQNERENEREHDIELAVLKKVENILVSAINKATE